METRIPVLPKSKSHKESIIEREELTADNFKEIIRSLNLKVTSQRLLILESLHKGKTHMTAQTLFEKVEKKDPTVGFATVYRFLKSLAESGFVTEVRMGGGASRYELTSKQHHDHLTCVKCGKICEFENPDIEKLQEKVAHHFGFQLTSHVLELYGLCSDCQTK